MVITTTAMVLRMRVIGVHSFEEHWSWIQSRILESSGCAIRNERFLVAGRFEEMEKMNVA
jgi:hypothetical protein